ncbi:MAG: radical SAM protein [Firmicutes bacterium]|jgi:putative pyruvate formate lyase activating enzyme|nr:radical SAM protein [Bacillota bacterium]
MHVPAYVGLLEGGELDERVVALKEKMRRCTVCPHHCGVDRLAGERGFCRSGARAVVNGYGPHFGEEEVLVGTSGSGTIFFSHCNLQCVFCQNCDISYYGRGREVDPAELCSIMIVLQEKGCHNINLVSPSHVVPQVMEAVALAAAKGLIIPIVYNTGGFDEVETLRLLDGVVDIYMPDIKFGDNETARKYTMSAGYFDAAKAAVREMHRQVGDLQVDESGIAVRGLLVRHLVMPGGLANTEKVMRFIADELSKDTMVNVMSQYYPAHRAYAFPELSRRPTVREYRMAVETAMKAGLRRLITD